MSERERVGERERERKEGREGGGILEASYWFQLTLFCVVLLASFGAASVVILWVSLVE